MPLFLTREEEPRRPMARAVFDPEIYPGKAEVRGDRISVNPGVTDGEDLRAACVQAMEGALCQGFEEIWFSARDNLVTPEALRDAVKAAAPAFMENGWLTVYLHCPPDAAAPEKEETAPPPLAPLGRLRRWLRRLALGEGELPPTPAAHSHDREEDPETFYRARMEEGFAPALCRMLAEKEMTDGAICLRANLDRRTLARLREDGDSCPGKSTAAALALALELSMPEANALLARAGYALSPCILFDVVILRALEEKNYDVYALNETLFRLGLPLLGQNS